MKAPKPPKPAEPMRPIVAAGRVKGAVAAMRAAALAMRELGGSEASEVADRIVQDAHFLAGVAMKLELLPRKSA